MWKCSRSPRETGACIAGRPKTAANTTMSRSCRMVLARPGLHDNGQREARTGQSHPGPATERDSPGFPSARARAYFSCRPSYTYTLLLLAESALSSAKAALMTRDLLEQGNSISSFRHAPKTCNLAPRRVHDSPRISLNVDNDGSDRFDWTTLALLNDDEHEVDIDSVNHPQRHSDEAKSRHTVGFRIVPVSALASLSHFERAQLRHTVGVPAPVVLSDSASSGPIDTCHQPANMPIAKVSFTKRDLLQC